MLTVTGEDYVYDFTKRNASPNTHSHEAQLTKQNWPTQVK